MVRKASLSSHTIRIVAIKGLNNRFNQFSSVSTSRRGSKNIITRKKYNDSYYQTRDPETRVQFCSRNSPDIHTLHNWYLNSFYFVVQHTRSNFPLSYIHTYTYIYIYKYPKSYKIKLTFRIVIRISHLGADSDAKFESFSNREEGADIERTECATTRLPR